MNMQKKNDPMTNDAVELNDEELAAIVGGAGTEHDHSRYGDHHDYDQRSRFHHRHHRFHWYQGPRFPWNHENHDHHSDWREPYGRS